MIISESFIYDIHYSSFENKTTIYKTDCTLVQQIAKKNKRKFLRFFVKVKMKG